MRIVFFGTPLFAAHTLSHLLKHGVDIVAVVTKPDRPQGRSSTPVPTPVKCVALEHQPPIPVFQPEVVSGPEYAPILAQFQADLFVVVAYGEIIKQHLLEMPKIACINVHPSLLPKYRGASPIQSSILNGDTETGVTIMHMTKKMDAGDIISVKKIPLEPNTTFGELEEELCNIGSDLLLRAIHSFEDETAQRTPQDHSQATIAKKIELEDCQVRWDIPAKIIHNRVRGVTPLPGAWCYVTIKDQQKRLRILSTRVDETSHQAPPGTILATTKEGVLVSCIEGAILLLQVQPEGKKPMSAPDFIRGLPPGTLKFTEI